MHRSTLGRWIRFTTGTHSPPADASYAQDDGYIESDEQTRLYSTKEASNEVGISIARVKQLRRDLGVGRMVGRSVVYTDADLDRMRQRNRTPGPKPRKEQAGDR